MKLLIFGGSGRYFKTALETLSNSDLIDEIVFVGRTMHKLEEILNRLSKSYPTVKYSCFQADVLTPDSYVSHIETVDMLINATGPYYETLLTPLNVAIESGCHYIDYADDGIAAMKANELDEQAKISGVTALIGMGIAPGLTNLIMQNAIDQFDYCEKIEFGWVLELEKVFGDIDQLIKDIKRSNQVNTAIQGVLLGLSHPMSYADNEFKYLQPFEKKVKLALSHHEFLISNPYCGCELTQLPRSNPKLKNITCAAGLTPSRVNDIVGVVCKQLGNNEITANEAGIKLIETVAQQKHILAGTEDDPIDKNSGRSYVILTGVKDQQQMRCTTYMNWNKTNAESKIIGTSGTLAEAALSILRKEVTQTGVLSPEMCFDPLPFFKMLAEKYKIFDLESPINIKFEKI